MPRPRLLATAVLAALLGFVTCWHCKPTAIEPKLSLVIPDTLRLKLSLGELDAGLFGSPPPPAAAKPEASKSRLRPGERLLVQLIRHRVSERLQKDGFALSGGNGAPVTKERAAELLAQLDDEQVLRGAHETGQLGDGTILERLGALFDWIVAHEDQIMAVVKFVMSLLMLFGDDGKLGAAEAFSLHGLDQPPGAEVGPAGLLPPALAV